MPLIFDHVVLRIEDAQSIVHDIGRLDVTTVALTVLGTVPVRQHFSDAIKPARESSEVREGGDGACTERLLLVAVEHVAEVADGGLTTGWFTEVVLG